MYMRAVVLNTLMFGSLSNISAIVYEKGLYVCVCIYICVQNLYTIEEHTYQTLYIQ